MRVKVWGARGSVPAPGPETTRYGGNTSCLQVTLSDGSVLVLDAGTGIRNLGVTLPDDCGPLHLLLTRPAPGPHPGADVLRAPLSRRHRHRDLGARGPGRFAREANRPLHLRSAVSAGGARAPLPHLLPRRAPHRVDDRPGHRPRRIGHPPRADARLPHHDGDTSLCYIPDHEPSIGTALAEVEPEWISGFELAHRASVLVHDCQYSDAEYAGHVGWGHSSLSDALAFARRSESERLLLFHHDPMHSDDFLDSFAATAARRWAELGGASSGLELAAERRELEVGVPAAA